MYAARKVLKRRVNSRKGYAAHSFLERGERYKSGPCHYLETSVGGSESVDQVCSELIDT